MNKYTWDLYKLEKEDVIIQRGVLDGAFHTHNHDFSELVVVLGGKGNHIIGDRIYPLHCGDIYVISGNTIHGFSEMKKLDFINIMLNPVNVISDDIRRNLNGYRVLFEIEPIYRLAKDFGARLTVSHFQLQEILSIVEEISLLNKNANVENKLIIKILINLLIAKLSVFYDTSSDIKTMHVSKLSSIVSYIEKNLKSNLGNSQLAKMTNYSPRHFIRVFNQIFKTTPQKYILTKRINHAAFLLESSKMSISEISSASGFSDSSYFTRVFSKKYEVTPTQFRKNSRYAVNGL